MQRYVCYYVIIVSYTTVYYHTVNDVVRGSGRGSNKNIANENAANDAFQNLNWTAF